MDLLCKFLIESSLPENKTLTDMNTQNPNDKILNYFRNLVGAYILFDSDLENQIHYELEEVLS